MKKVTVANTAGNAKEVNVKISFGYLKHKCLLHLQ